MSCVVVYPCVYVRMLPSHIVVCVCVSLCFVFCDPHSVEYACVLFILWAHLCVSFVFERSHVYFRHAHLCYAVAYLCVVYFVNIVFVRVFHSVSAPLRKLRVCV